MDYLASIIFDSKINHKKKLIHIFTPKCGGNSVTQWLFKVDEDWEYFPKLTTDIPEGYTAFATVRSPLSWVLSGYKMFKYHFGLPFDFEKHCQVINNPFSIINNELTNRVDWADYWWHCGITPDMHIGDKVKVFKLEELEKLEKWMQETYYENIGSIDHHNKSFDFEVEFCKQDPKIQRDNVIYVTKNAYNNIHRKMYYFAQKYDYGWNL